jgi:hypothetical protein
MMRLTSLHVHCKSTERNEQGSAVSQSPVLCRISVRAALPSPRVTDIVVRIGWNQQARLSS